VTWRDQAACPPHRDLFQWLITHPEASGPENRLRVGQAKGVCARCPVRSECLTAAVEFETAERGRNLGVAGGATYDERHGRPFRLSAPQRRPAARQVGDVVACEECAARFVLPHSRTRYCTACAPVVAAEKKRSKARRQYLGTRDPALQSETRAQDVDHDRCA
jgi:WhiB family transcriptional regulator, redox-sensing transcriptional regulator